MQSTIASAVILPEESNEAPSHAGVKRRQSSASAEDGSKRAKLNADGIEDQANGPGKLEPKLTAITAEDARLKRRRSGQLEERKRGQRLFGNLLGTLSQSSSSAAQKRRTDIDRKQQDKLRLQNEEQDEQRKQDLGALLERRKKEQVHYEEQAIRTRHSNMLAMAHSLKTKTEPYLYFRPWTSLESQDRAIQEQIEETKELIQREQEDFHNRRGYTNGVNGATQRDDDSPTSAGRMDEDTDRSKRMEDRVATTTNDIDPVPDTMQIEAKEEPNREDDDGGGVVMEGEEDTLIY